jgi:hypothetical protein
MKRKLLSILLTLCLAFSLLPTAALAEGAEAPAGGEPTPVETKTGDVTYSENDAKIENLVYTNGTMTVTGANVTIENVTFGDGAALVVNTTGDFTLTNCKFAPNTVYVNKTAGIRTAVYLKVGGNATVTNNTFEGVDNGYYNAIEFGINDEPALKGADISGNTFTTSIKNNYFSFYNLQEGAVVNIKDNKLLNSNKNSDGIRISNPKNVNAKFNIVNNTFTYNGSGANYDALILLQDYSKGESHQNFGSITLNIEELSAPQDITTLYYVWQDGTGVITTNQPVVKGDSSIEKFFAAKVGENYYKTLADAVKAVKDNETITLLDDVNLSSDLIINNGKIFTIDLNGKTLGGADLFINGSAFVTATNGTISGDVWLKATNTDIAYNSFTLAEDAKIDTPRYGIVVTQIAVGATNYGSAVDIQGSVTGKESALWVLGNITTDLQTAKNPVTVTVGPKAKLINSDQTKTALQMAGACVVTIADGAQVTGGTAIEVRAGKLTVDGGTITGTGIPTTVQPNGNGTSTTGAGIGVAQHTTGLPIEVTINSGAISGYTAFFESNPQGNDATAQAGIALNIAGGYFAATNGGKNAVSSESGKTGFISGGYFTSDPSAYKAEGKFVVASDKAGYSYMISGTAPTKAEVIVNDKTAVTVPTNKNLTNEDKTAIQTKTNIDGVAEAVAGSKDAIVKKAGVDASAVDASKLIEVEVAVDVAVSDVQKNAEGTAISTITFTAKPTATVKVDGTATDTTVPVENSMLNGQAITVKLPLPADFELKQIIHKSAGYADEYILQEGNAQGLKSFKIVEEDGVKIAVFTVSHFSTFELSGTVTYEEPSYSSGSSSYDPTYSVSTPSKTENGSVTVSPKSASKGDTVTVTVKPDSGYVLETLTVTDKNGNELTLKDKGNGKYTFTMPAGKVEVKATFMEDNSMLNFFYDVPNNAYFYEAVKWAVKNGITDGVGNNLFAPEQPCTRAQIVTFLWRAAGSPEPKGAASGMTDVVSGSYYEKAVAWAIENGITTGTTTSTFSPDATCTRAQAVTFLARALKAKAASAAEFSDVPTGSYFADAVAWAAANGVTEGIGGGLFGSDNDCTRGQIVTFLYRAYNK